MRNIVAIEKKLDRTRREMSPKRSIGRIEDGLRHKAYACVSLFSGCGGMDLGAEQSGLARVVCAIDNDHWAVESYKANLGAHVVEADIRDVKIADVPCDILLAGPPCQDFSSLWNHDGAKTSRGNLFREVARYLVAKAPAAFVMENVLGLLSANHGQAWTNVRRALRAPAAFLDTGDGPRYVLRVECIDMADLGVPQNRERLIIIGMRSDLGIAPPSIPLPFKDRHKTVREALENPRRRIERLANHEIGLDSPQVIERLKLIPPGRNYTVIPEGHHLAVKGLISHVYKRLDPDKPSYTIIASGGGGTHGYHYVEPRRLSNRERARLQSFPDTFVFCGPAGSSNPSVQYPTVRRQIGNAVPPEAAKVIVRAVADSLLQHGVRMRSISEIKRARKRISMMHTPSNERTLKIS
jgi:DNA (cytosine-5)-methyltransferase 1